MFLNNFAYCNLNDDLLTEMLGGFFCSWLGIGRDRKLSSFLFGSNQSGELNCDILI